MLWFILAGSIAMMLFYGAHLYLQALGIRRDEQTGRIVHSNETAIVVCAFWAIVFALMYFFGVFKVFVVLVLISWAFMFIKWFISTI